jgi:hypothetical protein
MDTLDARYTGYDNLIRTLDTGTPEQKAIAYRAAEGIFQWSETFHGQTHAYMHELDKAITRSAPTRVAVLSRDTKTEPDITMLRDGANDMMEIKHTEGDFESAMQMVYKATKQLLSREEKGVRRYIAEIKAPKWYPSSLEEWEDAKSRLENYVGKKAAEFTHTGNDINQLLVRLYMGESTVPITAHSLIPKK